MTAFADIILLSFNAATAIIFQVILAITFLREVFLWRYDLPALFLIICGSSCIILTANFQDVPLSVTTLKQHLTSIKSIAFYSFAFSLLTGAFFVQKRMLRCLALFERDAEMYLRERFGGSSVISVENGENSPSENGSQLML